MPGQRWSGAWGQGETPLWEGGPSGAPPQALPGSPCSALLGAFPQILGTVGPRVPDIPISWMQKLS